MVVRDLLKAVVKLIAMMVLALLVVAGAFGVGYVSGSVRSRAQVQPPPAAAASLPVAPSNSKEPAGFGVFWEAWTTVESQFYGTIPSEQDRVYGAARGMVATYGDPNTAFIEPKLASIFREDISGSFEGIGAAVRMDEMGRVVIAEPFVGQPAAKAGLLRGDVILSVDKKSLDGMSLYEAISLIRGPAGTTVVLTVARQGIDKPFDVPVVRARIENKVVDSKRLPGDIGYVSLSEFSRGASSKIADAIRSLEAEGQLKGLILDLRDNPGGLLDEAGLVASQFIDKGTVTIEREKGGKEQVLEAQPGGVALDVPLAVLVNRGSASASEIVSGAIKENGRGKLIGEQTFGKGTVQMPQTLSDGSELRVTIAEWLTPNKEQINGQGIVPDIVVERTQADFVDGRDPQLDRAVEYLSGTK
jgi:carboxyl-terminal processing protease